MWLAFMLHHFGIQVFILPILNFSMAAFLAVAFLLLQRVGCPTLLK